MISESVVIDYKLKKKQKTGRMQDVMKKLMRLSSYEQGEPWDCKRLKCFQTISHLERCAILFDLSRQSEAQALYHDSTYKYKVRIKRNDVLKEMPVCCKAFLSILGIFKGKLEHLQKSLKLMGLPPKD
ncbi:hypothetical protein ABEB36_008770 [Hypothenemus hampei]|uniref:Uncharacterized protein n=1 Tax=Hypothenemus hampei TaxID=57062 RepID=A0ABD1EN05_HYPHA